MVKIELGPLVRTATGVFGELDFQRRHGQAYFRRRIRLNPKRHQFSARATVHVTNTWRIWGHLPESVRNDWSLPFAKGNHFGQEVFTRRNDRAFSTPDWWTEFSPFPHLFNVPEVAPTISANFGTPGVRFRARGTPPAFRDPYIGISWMLMLPFDVDEALPPERNIPKVFIPPNVPFYVRYDMVNRRRPLLLWAQFTYQGSDGFRIYSIPGTLRWPQ